MDAAAAHTAVSPACRALADVLSPYDAALALPRGEELRAQGVDPALVSAAMTQARLRAHAVAKFGDFAAGMAFSQEGLEQATRLSVAALHARRYVDAGVTRVADLTCGLGADSMAMAALGLTVVGVEQDEATAILADHNLRHWPGTDVVHADALEVASSLDVDGVFADPARRNARGRRHDPSGYSPPLDALLALRERFPALGLKLGPAVPHEAVPPDAEAQWVSVDGTVVELGVWCGPLAHRTGHSALVIRRGHAHHLTGDTHRAEARELGAFVGEPDGAVIRAGLVGALADQPELLAASAGLLDPNIAYLTADSAPASALVRWYLVEESLPFDVKRLAAVLKARGVGAVEIKKRGVDVTPERLRAQLKLKGDASATVILTRVGGKHIAMVAQPA